MEFDRFTHERERLAKGCEKEGEQQVFHGGESCRLAKRLAMLCSRSAPEPRQAEEGDRALCPAVECQFTEHFTHHTGELEAVPAEAAGEVNPVALRVAVDDKVAVR